jgi:CRP/FNR family transcriptional regulator
VTSTKATRFLVERPFESSWRDTATLPCVGCLSKSFNVCGPLDYERQKELFEIGVVQTWTRRQQLFRSGDPIDSIFKVTSGIVAVSKLLPDGRRQILDFFLPGDLCGFLETDTEYEFDGEAITDATTCSFDRERFMDFSNRHPNVAGALRVAVTDRLKRAVLHMVVLGQLTSTERVATFLCSLTTAYGPRDIAPAALVLPMNRTDIADYLGLRLETVSRAFSRLRQRRLIEIDNDECVVINRAALVEISNSPYVS